jgi:signal transduction histidine kinase
MLQHSRNSTGVKEPTDINALCDEYLRLAYHGLRAKDKSFNATFETKLDPAIGQVLVMPQELGRVLLNLINNAFYAVAKKEKEAQESDSKYAPRVSIETRNAGPWVEIRIADNGTGIPEHLIDKIFQPFFTTKPTGEGTGLGLSLSYDIITKGHGGTLNVESQNNRGTTFIIQIPQNPST